MRPDPTQWRYVREDRFHGPVYRPLTPDADTSDMAPLDPDGYEWTLEEW